jgi:hypothetical protein
MTSSIHDTSPPLDCAAVDARLADYLDDEPPSALTADERAAVDHHVAACARCRPLVRDLRALADSAAALPELAPPRDLWDDIAPRLAARAPAGQPAAADDSARVLPFQVRHLRHTPPSDQRRGATHVTWPRRWLAAAAVALVTVSAGTTYLATRAATAPAGRTQVAAVPARPTTAEPATPPTATDAADAPAPRADGDGPSARPRPRAAGGAPERGPDDAGARFAARRAVPDVDAAVPAAAAYDREIAALRAVVRERRGELDSATVAVLVRNLGIIDAAIAQSRAALARDPHSQFLGDQLTRALGHKVELLRTVALMPRT